MSDDVLEVQEVGDDTAVVVVSGTTHGTDASRLSSLLEELLERGRCRLVVDLTGSRLLNSKLLDSLVTVAGRLDPRAGHGLVVVSGTHYVRQMLEIGATGGVLLLAETRDEALAAFA